MSFTQVSFCQKTQALENRSIFHSSRIIPKCGKILVVATLIFFKAVDHMLNTTA